MEYVWSTVAAFWKGSDSANANSIYNMVAVIHWISLCLQRLYSRSRGVPLSTLLIHYLVWLIARDFQRPPFTLSEF